MLDEMCVCVKKFSTFEEIGHSKKFIGDSKAGFHNNKIFILFYCK